MLNRNYLILLVFVLLILPFLFYNIKFIAEEYLAKAIDKLIKKFQISQIVASCTLIPLANGAPDVMVAMAATQNKEGLHIALGSLIGAFLFALTLIISSVVYGNKEEFIYIQRKKIFIEIIFYFLGLVIILIFGLIKNLSLYHALLYLVVYFIYIYFNLRQNDDQNNVADKQEKQSIKKGQAYRDIEKESIREDDQIIEIPEFEQQDVDKPKEQTDQIQNIKEYLLPQENHKIINFVELPFRFAYFVTIPSYDNPLIKTQLKFVLLLVSQLIIMQLFNISLNSSTGFMAAIAFLIVFYYIKIKRKEKLEYKIFLILSLFVSIAWLKLISSLVLDVIEYFSFLLNVSETFLSIVIISAGNSLGDLFANQALAQMGNQVVALLATFSSQVFNLYIGIAMNMIFSGNYNFELFDYKNANVKTESLLVHLILIAMGLLTMHLVYIQINNSKYKKSFIWYGLGFYVLFLIFMIVNITNQQKIQFIGYKKI